MTWCWKERSHSLKNSRVHYSELKKSFSSFSRRRFAAVHAMMWIWGGVLLSHFLFLFAPFIAAFSLFFFYIHPYFVLVCIYISNYSGSSEILCIGTVEFSNLLQIFCFGIKRGMVNDCRFLFFNLVWLSPSLPLYKSYFSFFHVKKSNSCLISYWYRNPEFSHCLFLNAEIITDYPLNSNSIYFFTSVFYK